MEIKRNTRALETLRRTGIGLLALGAAVSLAAPGASALDSRELKPVLADLHRQDPRADRGMVILAQGVGITLPNGLSIQFNAPPVVEAPPQMSVAPAPTIVEQLPAGCYTYPYQGLGLALACNTLTVVPFIPNGTVYIGPNVVYVGFYPPSILYVWDGHGWLGRARWHKEHGVYDGYRWMHAAEYSKLHPRTERREVHHGETLGQQHDEKKAVHPNIQHQQTAKAPPRPPAKTVQHTPPKHEDKK